jgi:hypothetical protein
MSCADVQTIQAGNGSKTQFSFDFPYLFKTEIEVSFWNATTKEWDVKATTDATYPWRVTDANPTIVEFTSTAPPSPATPVDPNESSVDNVRIRRTTSIDDIRALFSPGSAIRSDDLNKNFEQLRYAIQEANCQGVTDDVYQYLLDNYWDRFDNTLYSADTWRSDDATIATTAALDQRFQDEVNDTLTKAELAALSDVMPDDDVAVPTTGATKDYIDHVIETDILVDGTGLNKSGSGGQVTIGISAGSVDLDRIKAEDIITSAEANPNNDTTIATTAKIDDMIDAAITGDIAVDSTGLSVTDDGDGTITLGIAAGSVDLDRIKAGDIITQSEQDSGTTETDDNIFTALAAARRFDTFVQTGTPTGSDWEVGKTWLQNDSDLTLSIWNGSAWTAITSGGTFTNQPNVVYVDASSGDDNNDGHRISRPKFSITSAIDQINGEIAIDVTTPGFNGGSGYVDATYNNVSLTHSSGTGIGTGLTASITVSGGAVTAITLSAGQQTTLEEYSIGDVLTASNADLGGSGSGLLIPISGNGDGQIVVVAAGVYRETAPIQIKRRNVSIIGQALRSCIVHPTVATENNTLFELNSGSYIANLTLTGMQAGTGTGNTLDATLPTTQGWNFAFYSGAYIVKSPYIQNCTNFSDSEIDNSDLRAHRPRGGSAGDIDADPTGGGMLVNGATPADNSPLRSMVADSYTHVALNGPGILVVNNGYAQITSSYAFFNRYHIKCLTGGQANLAASTTDFGNQALVADGRSTDAIFSAALSTGITSGDITFTIDAPTAGASWYGTATRPANNMLVDVDGTFYPILSAAANGAGWDVTISRPDPTNRNNNLGIDGNKTTPLNVDFYLRSQIASSGHTMEYVGSGTDYTALPENGGVPVEANQVVELNNGKVWTATTDHNGKFKVGDFFEVDQQLGFVTIPEGSIAFNLLSDQSPQLGANLDVNGSTITGLPAVPTANDEAVSKQYVDTQIGGIDEVVEDLTPQLGGDLDVNGQSIVSTSNGDINITPNGTGLVNITGTTSIVGTLGVTGDCLFGEQLFFENGTATDPTLAWGATNQDTGIYSPGEDQLAITTGGTGRLFVDANGRVGINSNAASNTLTPLILKATSGTPLHFYADSAYWGLFDGGGTTGGYAPNNGYAGHNGSNYLNLFTAGNERLRITSTGEFEFIGAGTAGTTQAVYFSGSAPVNSLVIDSTGNVGLGTSPNARLHVVSGSGGGSVQIGNSADSQYHYINYGGSTSSHNAWQVGRSPSGGVGPANGFYIYDLKNSATRLAIDSSGRVGIGTISPGSYEAPADNLVIADSGNGGITIATGTSSYGSIYFADGTTGQDKYRGVVEYNHSNNAMGFWTDGTPRAFIDSSGRLLVGTSAAISHYGGNAHKVQIAGSDYMQGGVSCAVFGNTASGSYINLGLSRNTTIGSHTIVSDNDGLGGLTFNGSDGSGFKAGAQIEVFVDGTPGSNDMPGRLVFSTTADGANSPTERVRIKSNGQTEFSGAIFGDYNTASSGNIDFANGNFWEIGGQAVQNPTNEQPGLAGLLIAQSSAPASFTTQWKHPGGSYTAPTAFPAVAPFVVTAADTILVGSWTEGIA